MRLVTYNVNSLGARLPRVLALLEEHRPDVVLLQETKSSPGAFPHAELAEAGYLAADQSGGRWAGVAVLGRAELGVDDVTVGLHGEPDPDQARWVEATVGGITVVSVYVPNGQRVDSPQYASKLVFLEAMSDRMAALAAAGPVVVGGDMNVCPTDLDVWDPAALHGGTHATDPERRRFRGLLEAGYSDVFRALYPDDTGYSWWDYRGGAFHKGYGLRIDFLLASREIADTATAAWIDREFRKPTRVPESKPSGHAPLLAELDLELQPGPSATDDPAGVVAQRTAGDAQPEQLGLM